VGDYGKYGLLRYLCGLSDSPTLRLGVVWYLYPDESHNADGKHLGYLKNGDYRSCDAPLFESLKAALLDRAGALIEGSRHLASLEHGIFPSDTTFYAEPLSFLPGMPRAQRHQLRANWFAEAFRQTQNADLVFLDPDNGIECSSAERLSNKGPKYAYWDDLAAFVSRGQSLVVYHHLNRSTSHPLQVEGILEQIQERFPGCEPMATTFRRGSSRAFFIIPAAQNHLLLQMRLGRFAASEWSAHFVTRRREPFSHPQTDV
jgi:hypothetical protein